MYNGISFDVSDFWHLPDTLNDGVGKTTGAVLKVAVIGLVGVGGTLSKEGVFLVSGLEEVYTVAQGGGVQVILQQDDVRSVEDFIRVLGLESMEGANARGDLCFGMSWGIDSGWL